MLNLITIEELNMISPVFESGTKAYNNLTTNICRYRNSNKGIWVSYKCYDNRRKVELCYDTIPDAFKAEYNLPATYQEARAIIAQSQRAISTKEHAELRTPEIAKMMGYLHEYVTKNYAKYMAMYAVAMQNNVREAEKLAKEHALRIATVVYKDAAKLKLKDLHTAYLKLSATGTQNNYYKFTHLLKHQWTTEEGVNLVHGHTGKQRDDLRKLTDKHIQIIEELYKHPNQYSHNLITAQLNRYASSIGIEAVSRRSVSKYLNQPEVYNRLLVFRNKEKFAQTVAPFPRRSKALCPGDLYYMDGSPLQVPCWNKDRTKIIRPTLFVVLDSYSGKITGFHIAESEDRYTWFSAMKMAFSMEGLLPAEIVYDNASVTSTEEFEQLKDRLLLNGCKLRATKPKQPTAKAQVERWFGSFQGEYERLINGYVGQGIRSKRDRDRIDADFLKKVQKEEGYMTMGSIIETIATLIAVYNQKTKEGKTAPSKAFAETEKPNVNVFTTEQKALFFWYSRKHKISRSEIKIKMRGVEYYYKVDDIEMMLKLNGSEVKVFYDEKDMSAVQLFSLNDEYICELEQKVLYQEAQVSQTKSDVLQIMGQSSHKRAIERKLINDGKEKTAKAQIEIGDTLLQILNPLGTLKEDYNTAETRQILEYVRNDHDIHPIDVMGAKRTASQIDLNKKYSKKHQPKNIELVPVGKL